MRASHSLVRFSSCLLAYVLVIVLIAPLTGQSAASSVSPGSPLAAGAAPRGVMLKKAQADAASREGELLVRFREEVTEQGREGLAASKGARRKGKLRGDSRLERLELRAGQNPAIVAEQLRGEPGVELAEPNYLIARAQVVPNDPRFSEQ